MGKTFGTTIFFLGIIMVAYGIVFTDFVDIGISVSTNEIIVVAGMIAVLVGAVLRMMVAPPRGQEFVPG